MTIIRKPYSDFSMAIDLILDVYGETNPIIIAELIAEELGIEVSIHQISDYMDINRTEDFETQNLRQYYSVKY